MLMDLEKLFQKYRMDIFGVWHIGAHEAEEYDVYQRLGVPKTVWVEANPVKADALRRRFAADDANRVLEYAISDTVGWTKFHLASNGQSSSLLELGTHRDHHPEVSYVKEISVRAVTLDVAVFEKQVSSLNFWNLDIQGSELAALKGAKQSITMADYIYTEVNREPVYEGCGLVDEMDEHLAGWGFERVETEWTPFEWGDALYIRSEQL